MELPGAVPPQGFLAVLRGTSAHCQEGFIPIMDAPCAHASIGSQRRDAGFKHRLDASVEQSNYATSCRNTDIWRWAHENRACQNL